MPPGGPYFEMPGTSGAAPSSSIQLPSQASRELPSTVFDTDGYSTSTAPPVRVPASHRPSSGAWSYSDDQQLVAARSRGLNWNQIKNTHFPSKTANACRKRHERLSEKRDSDEWDNRKFQQLSREYMSMRKEIWSGLAARTGEKWSVVEQKVGKSTAWGAIKVYMEIHETNIVSTAVHVQRPQEHPKRVARRQPHRALPQPEHCCCRCYRQRPYYWV